MRLADVPPLLSPPHCYTSEQGVRSQGGKGSGLKWGSTNCPPPPDRRGGDYLSVLGGGGNKREGEGKGVEGWPGEGTVEARSSHV